MIKGYAKLLGILLGCGLLIQGCVSASSYRQIQEKYNQEMTQLKQHAESLGAANADMEQTSQGASLELKRAKLEIENMKQKSEADREGMLRLQEKITRIVQMGGVGITGVTVTPEGEIEIQGEVLFSPGDAEIKASAKEILNQLANGLKTEPNYYIQIAGHTDTDPIVSSAARWTTRSNFELAAYRALKVMLYFEEQGMDPARMFVVSYGEHRPKSTKKSENRRVTISFIKIPGEKESGKEPASGVPSK